MSAATTLWINGQLEQATVIKRHVMKHYEPANGGGHYVKTASFIEYSNGYMMVTVLGINESTGLKTKNQARAIAKKLQAKGFKFQ